MGNLRDGGEIVIGIEDGNPAALLPGLAPDDLKLWLDFDNVSRKLAVYADPPLRFDIEAMDLSSSAVVAVLHVYEFADLPHLCGKEYEAVLRKGALYVRTRTVPETTEVASSVEMRELLDLATEKALRNFVGIAERAGVRLTTVPPGKPTPSDEERYEDQRGRAW